MKKLILLLFFGVICFGVNAQKGTATNPNYWDLEGNSGTTSANFLGTADSRPLIIKTGNIERMRLLDNKPFLGIGTSNPQAPLHIHWTLPSMPFPYPQGADIFKILHIGTTTTGNGFSISSSSVTKSLYLFQHEDANLIIRGPGGGLSITPDGNIGVGLGIPEAKLDVTGSFKAQSATITNTLEAKTLKAQNATLTGALSAESATISGAITIKGTVNGKNANFDGLIRTKEVNVTLSGWSDFVFDDDYELMPLSEVKQFITENKHLPHVPSEAEVIAKGVNIGEMNAILLQKVEELTLYILDLQKQINELKTNKP